MHRKEVFIVLFVLSFFVVSDGFVNLADMECGVKGTRQGRSEESTQERTEGVKSIRQGRIVGGAETVEDEMPWTASVWRQNAHQCGATVVTSSWLLTAGHCVCSSATFDFFLARQLKVVVGSHDLTNIDVNTKEAVSRILPHPSYRCDKIENDIALLQTSRELKWRQSLRPACLPQPAAPDYSGAAATAAGWGWTHEDRGKGKRPNILHKVELKVIDNTVCTQWYHSHGKKINVSPTQMCVGHEEGGRDTCWADSGGPLVLEEPGIPGTYVVAGVVSTGHGCARPKLPGIYTRVSRYVEWIRDSVGENKLRTGLDWYPR